MTDKPVAVRPAASVVLWRPGPRGIEVFWVRRGEQLRFAGGFYAFPGGRVDEADAALPLTQSEGLPAIEAACVGAAARELFEETGVLAVAGAESVPAETLKAARKALLDDDGRGPGFAGFLQRHGLHVDTLRYLAAGRWVTPPQMPVRFDARFFMVELPPGQKTEVWPGELADGEWIRPEDALARWESGAALLHPPAWHTLRALALPQSQERPEVALPLLQDPSRAPWSLPIDEHVVKRIEFQQGMVLVPLRTPTLPPATHTNCLLLGEEDLWVVDPGSPYEDEQRVLEDTLAALASEGRVARGIVLTHEHHDHVGGAVRLAHKLKIPIAASEQTRSRLEELGAGVPVDRVLRDGEVFELGARRFRTLVLPGHTRGHTCLFDETSRAVVAGDLVAGVGTVIIDPPEGDMADYLDSLKRLIDLGPRTLYPAHGPVIPGGVARLKQYVAHRLDREAKVAAALSARGKAAEPGELVPAAYPDVAPALYGLAERSLLAHLLKLEKEGRARRDPSGKWMN